MFYISRRIDRSEFGVIDTSDGAEDFFTFNAIRYAVLDLGIEIRGVCTNGDAITTVSVYQNPIEVSREQLKFRVLYGIAVKTIGSEIVGIEWDRRSVQKKAELRLSDWGRSCGNCILFDAKALPRRADSWLTIVLDDRIEFTSETFLDFASLGVAFDIRELIDEKLVEFVYRELIVNSEADLFAVKRYIRDNEARLNYWMGVAVLYNGSKSGVTFGHISEVIPNSVEVNRMIDRHYFVEFTSFADCEFKVDKEVTGMGKYFISLLGTADYKRLLTSMDFDVLKNRISRFLFDCLLRFTPLDDKALTRYEHYIRYFDVCPEIKESFVKFCHRGLNWFAEYGVRMGILERK